MRCIFCSIPKPEFIAENDSFYAIKDKFPVTRGHTLIVSKRHFQDFFAITEAEMADLRVIIMDIKHILDSEHSPDAFNIGMNCGKHAGQSVFHFHLHVIPRYENENKTSFRKKMQGLREYINEIL